ncbi:MAG: cellulose binding domain-containing protein [Clostridiales bacterium]
MIKFSKWKNYKKLNIILTIIFLITFLTIMFVVNLSAASTNSGNFTVDYAIQSNWGSGAIVNVTITNNGSTVEDWTVKWNFDGNEKITNMWSAEYTQSGSSVTVKNNDWNGTISNKGSQSFGFIFNYSGDISTPSDVTVTSTTSVVDPTTVEPKDTPTAIVNTSTVPTVTSIITTPEPPEVETPSSLKSFPGAEGAGAYTSGGRDGDIYFVTNLKDSGPGSLREGVDTTPSEGRTILFKVSGTIKLTTGLQINKENITIAGQSAPGDGICISGKTVYIGKRPPRKVGEFLGNNI